MKFLRKRGVTIVIYIDDTLLIARSVEELKHNVDLTIKMLEQAGFMVNFKKSHLTPSTRLEFLGFIIDTVDYTITLCQTKLTNLLNIISTALCSPTLSICQLSKIIGKIVAIFPCCECAPLHYRILDRFKCKMLRQNNYRWGAKIKLSSSCLQELVWWKDNLNQSLVTRHLHEPTITQHLFSDSSGTAFGGWWKDKHVQSRFLEKQAKLSINTKELLAVFYTISSFAKDLSKEVVLIHCDNSVTVSCIHKLGSSDPLRDRIVRKLYDLADLHKFKIKVTWITGKRNKTADILSRRLATNIRTEWSLDQSWFNELLHWIDFTPEVDLFASHLNTKISKFCSRTTDPLSWHVDAFTISWTGLKIYCFAPFSLIGRILKKIESDQVQQAMVIVPLHPSSSWFPRFIHMCREPPLLLPKKVVHSLKLPWDSTIRHPLHRTMRLLLGSLSCNISCSTAYSPDLSITLRTMDGETVLLPDTPLSSRCGHSSAKLRRRTATS